MTPAPHSQKPCADCGTQHWPAWEMSLCLDALENAVRAAGIQVHHHSDPTTDVWAQIDRMRIRLTKESV